MNLRKIDEIVHANIEQLVDISQALQGLLEIFYEHWLPLEVRQLSHILREEMTCGSEDGYEGIP
jgi:hypothetical protein